MNMANVGVSNVWKILIQPDRVNYSMDNLGSKLTYFEHNDCYRKDFSFSNNRNNQISVSLFIPFERGSYIRNHEALLLDCPCLVYCHSQSGNRIEGLFLQEWCIENGYGLCLFDFDGCGKSQGEYVTLGWKEQDDLEHLINILTKDYKATQIALWGRSMGAVASIMYAKRHSLYLSAMILDSPFSDISVMVKDVAYELLKLPGLIVGLALKLMSSSIKDKVNFDILNLKPIEFAKTCTVPCVFIIGEEDKLVLPKRVQEIFNVYAGKQKIIITSQGDHSSEREPHILSQCFKVLFHEIKKNSYVGRQTILISPEYVDYLNDPYLNSLAKDFLVKVETNIRNTNTHKNIGSNLHKGQRTKSYNFDYCDDDTTKDGLPIFNTQIAEGAYGHLDPYNASTMDSTFDKESQYFAYKDFGDVSREDIEKNIQDISIVIKLNKL